MEEAVNFVVKMEQQTLIAVKMVEKENSVAQMD